MTSVLMHHSFGLTQIETVCLAGVAGVQSLTGVPNPFEGWLAAEVRTTLAEAGRRLADRRLLIPLSGGRYSLCPELKPLFQAWAAARWEVVLHRAEGRSPPAVHCFHAGAASVEIASEPSGTELLVQTWPDPGALLCRLLELLQLPAEAAPSDGATILAQLPGPELALIRRLADESGSAAAWQQLAESGVKAHAARMLAEAMAHPLATGMVTASRPFGNGRPEAAIGLLLGAGACWHFRLRQSGPDPLVEIVQGTQAGAAAVIGEELERLRQLAITLPDR